MKRLKIFILSSLTIVFLSACSDSEYSNYQELSWEGLRPLEEIKAEQESALSSLDVNEYWYQDESSLGGGLSDIYAGAPQQSMASGVVTELDGKSVRVPGFVVPVEFDGENLVTEFFLVPYFGACFHKPPPPPNQTIYVKSSKPVEYQSIYDPVWIMGVIKTEQTGNNIAMAAYSMDLQGLTPFDVE